MSYNPDTDGWLNPDTDGWLFCISETKASYEEQIKGYDDDFLVDESERVEVHCPPSAPHYNTKDWRLFRRLIRQEMRKRGFA